MNTHSYTGGFMKQYKVKTLDLKTGETMAYRQAGKKGPVILLIHGNMSSSVHFQPLMEMLEKDFQVYAIDLPGFGDSTYNRPLDSLQDIAKDVGAFIEHLDLSDINLVGWSTGGGVALETAVDYVDRIRQIFLLSSVGVQGLELYDSRRRLMDGLKLKRIFRKEEIAADPFTYGQSNYALTQQDRDYFKLLWSQIYKLKQPDEADFDCYIDAVLKQRNLLDIMHALAIFNMTTSDNGVSEGSGRLYQLRIPITLLHGDHDAIVSIEDAKNSLEFIGNRAELIVFEDANHSLLTDDLLRVYEEIVTRIVDLD